MAGYAARKGPAEGVLQDLHAKALGLEDPTGNRLLIVTFDLIGVPKPLRVDLERIAAEKFDLAPQALLLNASHTHCGPMIRLYQPAAGKARPPYANVPEEEEEARVRQTKEYLAFLKEQLAGVMGRALEERMPAVLSWHRARCGFAMNRRTPLQSGPRVTFKNAPNPEGPVDHEVPVLRVASSDEELKAVLFGYACHATTLNIMQINGDWPGYAQQVFEQDHPGVTALFLNGCSGDQNPYPRRMHYYAERHGRSMATAIEAALETPAHEISGQLRTALRWVPVPYGEPPAREELENRLDHPNRYERRYAELLLEHLDARGSFPESYPVPVQTVQFGQALTLVAIGGEVTVDYSLRLERELARSDDHLVWVAGYSNDVMCYLPSERVLREGGYEGATSMRYARSTLHPTTWASGIEARIVGAVHELLDTTSTTP